VPRYDPVVVYDKTTGRKIGRRPRSWLARMNVSETPAARARRSPKKKQAPPATELPGSGAESTAPEEEK
jgi:hypothetical protein